MTSALLRIRRPFWMVTSMMDDPDGQKRLAEYITAAGILRRMKSARIAVFGHAFEGMTDLMIDQLSLRQYVGPVCWPVEPEKVSLAMDRVAEADVKALVKKESGRYKIDIEASQFERSCRLALAMEKVTREGKFDAVASFDQVWLTDPSVGIIPSYATGRLCELGFPTSTEADLTTVTAMLMLQELAGKSTFLENYVIDFKRDAMILSHDGHGNPALAAKPADVSLNTASTIRVSMVLGRVSSLLTPPAR